MAFINQAVTVLQTLVIALGAGLAVWGVVNLMEGYGNDNPGANSHGNPSSVMFRPDCQCGTGKQSSSLCSKQFLVSVFVRSDSGHNVS